MAHYTDLLQLDAHRPQPPESYDPHLGAIPTPLNIEAWSQCLIRHPDQKFPKYIITGLNNGFRIGYDWSRPRLCAKANMPSVKAHPAIVQQFIDSELREGHMFGLLAPNEIQYPVHISRFGVIEKKNQPGKFHLIVARNECQ